jgi:hypothetical protein
MKKGRCSWTREPLHRPFVAWNQVDAIIVATCVPNAENGCFWPLSPKDNEGQSAIA